jgi:glycosyltransferase involved in cell wall biosynthesis
LIAKKLAKKCSKKWIADFRDPWTEAFWTADAKKMALSKYIDLRLEKSVLRNIDAFTTVSEGVAKLLFSKVENKYIIIQNGFEPLELKEKHSDYFLILYSGHLRKYQNPRALFQALDTLPETIKTRTKIVFIGTIFEEPKLFL